jgi:hypothetical protein
MPFLPRENIILYHSTFFQKINTQLDISLAIQFFVQYVSKKDGTKKESIPRLLKPGMDSFPSSLYAL